MLVFDLGKIEERIRTSGLGMTMPVGKVRVLLEFSELGDQP